MTDAVTGNRLAFVKFIGADNAPFDSASETRRHSRAGLDGMITARPVLRDRLEDFHIENYREEVRRFVSRLSALAE